MAAGNDVVVEVTVGPEGDELAADRLWAAGATAVGWRTEPGATVLVASFPTADAARSVAGDVGGRPVDVDPAWRDTWRAFAEPVEVAPGLVVVPAWRPVDVESAGVVLSIDPGPVFGSGSHASTRLLLRMLAAEPPVGAVLDVGTGSGILAVAAAVLGASSVVAVDIDPDSVGIARANAAGNGVADRVDVSPTPVADLEGRWDLALVNVTAGVHAELGPSVARLVAPGGAVWLAGLLPGQWPHVSGAYPGCELVAEEELDGWVGARLVRR